MANHITFELCDEDRGILYDLVWAIKELNTSLQSQPNPCTALPSEATAAVAEVTTPKTEEPVKPEKSKATPAAVQALVQRLATPTSGKRNAVKEIVNAYAARVSEIPEDKLDEVMRKLVELEED